MTDELLHDEVGQEEIIETGRRGLLGKAAVAAVVAAATGVGISRPASAGVGNGVNFTQGAANTGATLTTSLAGGSTLKVTDGATAGPVGDYKASIYAVQSATSAAAVLGEANGTGYGWAVYGKNTSSQGIGVRGYNNGLSGIAVYGRDEGSIGIGVYGEHAAAGTEGGTGVVGKSNTGVGVAGNGATVDLQAQGSGKVVLAAAGFANPPAGASTVGTLARDAAGNLWYSPASGVYRKLAGATSAGAFHAITPTRVYDSRALNPAQGALAAGANRTLSIKDARDLTTGSVTTADVIPAGATAVTANVTVVNTAGAGFLAVNPGGNTVVSAATVNWFASGQILNNGVTLTISASREVTVIAGGGNTDFVIDVTGYFL